MIIETIKRGIVEVLTTNIQNKIQAKRILKMLEISFPQLKIMLDLSETKQPYPCGHTLIRLKGNAINAEK